MSNRVQGLRLKSALHVHANKLAANLGVRVAAGGLSAQFHGSGAFAMWSDHNDPRKVVHGVVRYPAVPDHAMLTRGEADLFTGYTLHEVGHIAFTDNSDRPDKRLALFGPEADLLFKLWNGIEDGRMESAVIRDGRSRGARSALKRLVNKLTLDVTPEWSPTALRNAPFALALLCRSARGVGNGFSNTLLGRIPEPKRSLYAEAMAKCAELPVEKVAGTKGSWNVAIWFYEEWKARFGVNVAGRIVKPKVEPDGPVERPEDGGKQPEEHEEHADDDTLFKDKLDPSVDPKDLPESDEPAPPPDIKSERDKSDDVKPEEPEDKVPGNAPAESDDDDDDDANGEGTTEHSDDDEDDDDDSDDDDEAQDASTDGEPGEEDDSVLGGEADDDAETDGDTSSKDAAAGDDLDAGIPFDEDHMSDNTVNHANEIKSPEPDLKDLSKRLSERTKQASELRYTPPANFSDMSRWKNADRTAFNNERVDEHLHRKMLGGGAAKVKALVTKLLTAPERVGWDGGAFAGRFDRKRYVPAMNGSEAVFKRRWETEGLNTALSIVIDLSGSMGGGEGSPLGLAVDCAYAIADAAEKARCPVEILGFSDVFGGSAPAAFLPDMKGDHNSTGQGGSSYALVVAKRFNVKLRQCATNIGRLKNIKTGGTPDYPCIRTAAMRLSARPEARRILMVLTDGCGYTSDMHQLTLASKSLMGVDIIGVGIGMREPSKPTGSEQYRYRDPLEESYPLLRAYVPNYQELAGASMQALQKALAAGAKHRRTM